MLAAGRLALAAALAAAVVLDQTEPLTRAPLIRILSFSYLAYALGIVILTWTRQTTTRAVPIAMQVTDVLVAAIFTYFTDGTRNPFIAYFVFSIVTAGVRWHRKGALIAGTVTALAYMVSTLGGAFANFSGDFNTPEFVARSAQLLLITALLAHLGRDRDRIRTSMERLATWPSRLSGQEAEAIREMLDHAAATLSVPRIVLAWEEGDEPSLRLATLTPDRFDLTHHRPDVFGALVADTLERSSFAAIDVGTSTCRVLQRVSGTVRLWTGSPLDEQFRRHFNVQSVLALRLASDNIHGWLFALDRNGIDAIDLVIGDVVAHLVTTALELQSRVEQLKETAVGEARVHLARELHDGVLQSLTAASLQAKRARQSISNSPAEAERRLAMIEETILAEQQALRLAIEDLKPGAIRDTTPVDVGPRVSETATRVARHWDVRVHLNLQRELPRIPQKIAHELTRMLQEAMVNSIRHGGAKEITVTCLMMSSDLALAVSYQGRGFAGFQGRHDLASLNRMKVGPRTLKERVAAVSGSLVIESAETGARVEIRIPLLAAL